MKSFLQYEYKLSKVKLPADPSKPYVDRSIG